MNKIHLCFRNDLGFVGIQIDPDTTFDHNCHHHEWQTIEGIDAIKKLQKLKKHPIRCYLNVIICTGDDTFRTLVSKINYAELNKKGYPHISFEFDDNGIIYGSPTYNLNGWGVKETREVKVKEYHVKGDILKNESTVKQLVISGQSNIDVVLEDGEIIPAKSIRRFWAPQIEIHYDPKNPMAYMTRVFTPPSYESMRFVTYDGIKYIIK